MKKPLTFWVHFNRFNARRGARDCWTIHTSSGCKFAKHVHIKVPVQTIYKGDTAPQPRAYLKGKGTPRHLGEGNWVID